MVDNLAPELTTIYLERDMTFAVADEETARTFVADVEGATAHFDGEEWQVTRPAGSEVRVPRRVAMTRFVGGQIPQGFDPGIYGIPADMIDNLDRVALWNLVCTVDAFVAGGFSPAELLANVHPARVSSTQGTGMAACSRCARCTWTSCWRSRARMTSCRKHCRMSWQRTSCSLMSAVMARWSTRLPRVRPLLSLSKRAWI